MRTNCSITKLVLSNIDSEPQAFVELGQAISHNRYDALQILDLSGNSKLDKNGIPTFSLSFLSSLFFSGVAALRGAFSSFTGRLTWLSLANCSLSAKDTAEIFYAFLGNYSFSLGIEHLDLSNNKFDDSTWRLMSQWFATANDSTHLKHFFLSGTNLNAKYIVSCKTAPHLETLDLSNNKISDSQQPYIAHLLDATETIKSLNLANCGLSSSFIEHICSLIFPKPYLSDIDLNIANNGSLGSYKDLGRVLGLGKNMMKLDISGIKLKERQLSQILGALTNPNMVIEELNINDTFVASKKESGMIVRTELENFLTKMPNLRRLCMANGFGRNLVSHVLYVIRKKDVALEILDIQGNAIGNIGATHLGDVLRTNSSLTELFIDNNNITVRNIQSILSSLLHSLLFSFLVFVR